MILAFSDQAGYAAAFLVNAVNVYARADNDIRTRNKLRVAQLGLYARSRFFKMVKDKTAAFPGSINKIADKGNPVGIFQVNKVFSVLGFVDRHVYARSVCLVGKQVAFFIGEKTLKVCKFSDEGVFFFRAGRIFKTAGKGLRGKFHRMLESIFVFCFQRRGYLRQGYIVEHQL